MVLHDVSSLSGVRAPILEECHWRVPQPPPSTPMGPGRVEVSGEVLEGSVAEDEQERKISWWRGEGNVGGDG